MTPDEFDREIREIQRRTRSQNIPQMVSDREEAIYKLVQGLSDADFKTMYLSRPAYHPQHVAYTVARCIRLRAVQRTDRVLDFWDRIGSGGLSV